MCVHEIVEVQLTLVVEAQELGNVRTRITRTEQRADHLLLHQRQIEQTQGLRASPRWVNVGGDDPAALGGQRERLSQQLCGTDTIVITT